MATASNNRNDKETASAALGCGFMSVVAIVIVYLVVLGFNHFFPKTSTVLVSTAVNDLDSEKRRTLTISGMVLASGAPVKRGTVQVTAEQTTTGTSERFALVLENGSFKIPEISFEPANDVIRISAEAWSPEFKGAVTSVVIVGKAPLIPRLWLYTTFFGICGLLAVSFILSFTGPQGTLKNRVAIILSYAVILIFLAIPLAAPIAVTHMFPQFLTQMEKTPVGFVVAEAQDRPEPEPQWVLNIGGYVNALAGSAGGSVTHIAPGAAAGEPSTTSPSPGSPAPSVSPPEDISRETVKLEESDQGTTRPMKINGGLVIPLYVIVLSVIGGAINMTRKVPSFQKQAEAAAMPFSQRFVAITAGVGRAVKKTTAKLSGTGKSEPPEEAHPTESQATGQDSVSEPKVETDSPIGKPIENATPESLPSPENAATETIADTNIAPPQNNGKRLEPATSVRGEDAEQWRIGLLSEYMYLISAPFLAIATYYLCIWLDVKIVPLFVLVSFSVGLISDQIIVGITGVVTSLISKRKSQGGANLAPNSLPQS